MANIEDKSKMRSSRRSISQGEGQGVKIWMGVLKLGAFAKKDDGQEARAKDYQSNVCTTDVRSNCLR